MSLEQEQSWKDNKSPEEISELEAKGKALVDHLIYLDLHPEIPPSSEEETSIKKEIEKRNQIKNSKAWNAMLDRI